MRALVWFRADLRTRDNPALHAACRDADDGVVALFTICPDQWIEHDWADFKVDFLLRNLRELSDGLANLDIPLLIRTTPRFSGVPGVVNTLLDDHRIDALYFNDEYELNEARRDEAVQSAAESRGCTVHRFTDQVIMTPGDIRTKQDTWYTVFTPFKKAWLAHAENHGVDAPLSVPRHKHGPMLCDPDHVPECIDHFDPEHARPDLWTAGEDHAASRLRAFIEGRINGYKDKRDTPSTNGTSTISPYLAIGVISARRCFHEAREAHGSLPDPKDNSGPATWIGELIWREFYKHLLAAFPRLSMHRPFRTETDAIEWRDDDDAFDAWREGRTGYPIVDAAMRQLVQTGWMHNRLRMITAMFLTKDLLIDWRRGERHFMRHLVDGDLASNNGGWQWSASTGTDAAPYFRIFNPESQSKRYDPEGDFIRKFIPELSDLDSKDIHNPPALARASLDYPQPICDHKERREQAIAAFKALS